MNLVQKYGGDYLKDMTDLRKIAVNVSQTHLLGDGLVIVVAAMHEIAASTFDRAAEFGEDISKREANSLFASCEIQTAALMAAALDREGVDAVSITDIKGHSLNLVEVDEGKHEIELGDIKKALDSGKVAVVSGFQGIGEYDMSDRLGRYGAAATAVAIAAGLECDCELYGNTKGIYTVEPDARYHGKIIKKICYEEAMEMLLLGESDLESRAIELGKNFGVKIYVGPAFDKENNGGTWIMDRKIVVQEGAVTGITVSGNIVIYTIRGIPVQGDSIAELFDMLGDMSVNIDVISQQTCTESTCALSFSCDKDNIEAIDKALESNVRFRGFDITKEVDVCLVSLVGVGMASHVGVAGKVFGILARNNIRHYNITTSEISISAVIDEVNRPEAIISLSEAFDL